MSDAGLQHRLDRIMAQHEPEFTTAHLVRATQYMVDHPNCEWDDAKRFAMDPAAPLVLAHRQANAETPFGQAELDRATHFMRANRGCSWEQARAHALFFAVNGTVPGYDPSKPATSPTPGPDLGGVNEDDLTPDVIRQILQMMEADGMSFLEALDAVRQQAPAGGNPI